jgi:hypothetical protein
MFPPLAEGVIEPLDPGPLSPRWSAATAAVDGRLLVYGGVDDGVAVDDGALFDPASGTWDMIPSSGGLAAGVSAAATDGMLIVLAGRTTAAALDLVDGSWSWLPPPPADPSGMLISAGHALFFVSHRSPDGPDVVSRLDPAGGDWVQLPEVPAIGYVVSVHMREQVPLIVMMTMTDRYEARAFMLDGRDWRDLEIDGLDAAFGIESIIAGDDLLVWGGQPPGRPELGNTFGLAYSLTSGEWRQIAPLPVDWWECYAMLAAIGGIVRGDVCGVLIEYDVAADEMAALGVLDGSQQVPSRWVDVGGTSYRWGEVFCYAECEPVPLLGFQRWP